MPGRGGGPGGYAGRGGPARGGRGGRGRMGASSTGNYVGSPYNAGRGKTQIGAHFMSERLREELKERSYLSQAQVRWLCGSVGLLLFRALGVVLGSGSGSGVCAHLSVRVLGSALIKEGG